MTTTTNTELDEFLSTVLAQQLEAERAIHDGDLAPRLAMWTRADPVTVFGAARSGSGWDEVSEIFRWVTALFSDCTDYRFELVAAGLSGDLAYTVGYENSVRAVRGGPPEPSRLRATHVYRRENGQWRIVHRHADVPPAEETHLLAEHT